MCDKTTAVVPLSSYHVTALFESEAHGALISLVAELQHTVAISVISCKTAIFAAIYLTAYQNFC